MESAAPTGLRRPERPEDRRQTPEGGKERGREGWRDGGSEGGGVAHREGSGGLPAVPGQDGETE